MRLQNLSPRPTPWRSSLPKMWTCPGPNRSRRWRSSLMVNHSDNSVPRWGTYNGVKYYPKRSILKTFPICHQLFLQYHQGRRLYCGEACSREARRRQMQRLNAKIIAKRDRYQHAQDEALTYYQGLRSKNQYKVGTEHISRPPQKVDGSVDYEGYH